MFAYCLNNPVVHTDESGSAAKTCLTADGAIDDTPWWDHSPGGGGFVYHYTTQSCGESRTQRFLRETWSAIKNDAKWVWDTYSQEYIRRQELEHQQLLAQHKVIKDTYDYLTSDEFLSTDVGIVVENTIVSAEVGAGMGLAKSLPGAVPMLPVNPPAAFALMGKAMLVGFVEGAIGGFICGLIAIS